MISHEKSSGHLRSDGSSPDVDPSVKGFANDELINMFILLLTLVGRFD